jgi:hypothetical protein
MTFVGELTAEEVDYVIGIGLNFLLQNGALQTTPVLVADMGHLND